jgi:hypothetical protein
MGMKARRGPRAAKVPVQHRKPAFDETGADPCTAVWEFWFEYSRELAPYVTVGADVYLYPKDGKVVVMIGTREIGILRDPAVPQIVDCMDLGYMFTGTVVDVAEEASRVRLRVSGTRADERA